MEIKYFTDTDGYLNVIKTDTFDFNGYVILEFVSSSLIKDYSTTQVISKSTPEKYTYHFLEDGLYAYHLMKISTTSVTDKIWYDSSSSSFKCNSDTVTLEYIIEHYEDVINYLSFDDVEGLTIFSIYYIDKCCKQSIENATLSEIMCGFEQNGKIIDFLFITKAVLQWLIEQKRYTEATDIITKIKSCDSICSTINKTFKICNC